MTITRYQPGKRLAAAVKHNNTLYLSGQVANNATASVEEQTKDILGQIDGLLKEAGADKSKLLMVNIYLPNMADFAAMRWADVGLLVLPCGRSAHLELGWMAGAGKRTIILTQDNEEPELMALLADHIAISPDEVLELLK